MSKKQPVLKAWSIHVEGFPVVYLAAKTREKARYYVLRELRDIGYYCYKYIDIVARRAPHLDKAAVVAGETIGEFTVYLLGQAAVAGEIILGGFDD